MLHNFLRSTTFVLGTSSSEILNYHCTLTYDYRHMYPSGINSIKTCGVYLFMQTISNKKNFN
jgi:hypothetical protein